MRDILITGVWDTRNNGCMAMLECFMCEVLERRDARFRMHVNHGSRDAERLGNYPIALVPRPWSRLPLKKGQGLIGIAFLLAYWAVLRATPAGLRRRIPSKFLRSVLDAEAAVDISGDTITEDYGWVSLVTYLLTFELILLAGKPLVILAQTIGPFENRFFVRWVRSVFGRARLITVREELSHGIVNGQLGQNGRAPMTADMAFILTPRSTPRTESVLGRSKAEPGALRAGLNASAILERYFHGFEDGGAGDEYIGVMARAADNLCERWNAEVFLVPHVTIPGIDDRDVLSKIYARMKHKDRTVLVDEELTAREYKAVIASCGVFAGARMHATIAAMSAGVPTLVLAYSNKAIGINGRMLGQSGRVLDIRAVKSRREFEDALEEGLDRLIQNRDSIRRGLEDAIRTVKEKSRSNFDLLEEALSPGGAGIPEKAAEESAAGVPA